jgi:hypothetical protein
MGIDKIKMGFMLRFRSHSLDTSFYIYADIQKSEILLVPNFLDKGTLNLYRNLFVGFVHGVSSIC